MAHPLMAYCGADDCETCHYRLDGTCAGCRAVEGKPFWGGCQVAQCCRGKGLEHCGQCRELPCDMLRELANHPTEGDNGARIENARAWAAMGYEAWRQKRGSAQQ